MAGGDFSKPVFDRHGGLLVLVFGLPGGRAEQNPGTQEKTKWRPRPDVSNSIERDCN